jgi:hypothetical protein
MPKAMNIIAIIVAAVAGMVIGMLWFGPVFGKFWMRLSGITSKDVAKLKKDKKFQKRMTLSYVLAFIGQIVTAAALSYLIDLGGHTAAKGACIGLLAGIGFAMTTMLSSVLWENRTWKLYFFNSAYYLVLFIAMGLIIGAW